MSSRTRSWPGPKGTSRSRWTRSRRPSACSCPPRSSRSRRAAVAVEDHYGVPMDVEWCIDDRGALRLVQARPVTALSTDPLPESAAVGTVLVRGLGASPGVTGGSARVLRNPSEGASLLDGEVLVAPMTNPDWLPTLRRAAAVVTDSGGVTCHAAIVSRELGIPCIVGARTATDDDPDRRRRHGGRRGRDRVPRDGSQRPGEARRGPGARREARRHPSPAPSCTSTSRWPRRPRKRRPWTSTVSACCAPSSSSPTRCAAGTRER